MYRNGFLSACVRHGLSEAVWVIGNNRKSDCPDKDQIARDSACLAV
jgi:hypothetical protein